MTRPPPPSDGKRPGPRRGFRTEFARNVAILTSGTVLARLILALAAPVLTRLYTPADFELLAVYMAILALFTVIANLRFYLAIPLPEQDAQAMNLLALAVLASLGSFAVLALAVAVAPGRIVAGLDQPDLAPFLWLIPTGVLLASLYQSLQFWSSRKKRFALVTRTRVARAAGGVGSQLGIGVAGGGSLGLLLGHMIYTGWGVIGLARDIRRQDRALFADLNRSNLADAFRAYRRFPTLSVPEALCNAAGAQVPILIIAAATASAEAGFLVLALQIMAMPLALIGRSVEQVYLAEAAAHFRAGTLGDLTRRTTWNLFRLSVLPIVLMGVISPFVFAPVFGAEWVRAGVIVAWLTPMALLQFVTSPVSTVLHVTGRLGLALALQAAGFAIRAGAVLTVAWGGWAGPTETFAIASALFYGGFLIVVLRLLR